MNEATIIIIINYYTLQRFKQIEIEMEFLFVIIIEK